MTSATPVTAAAATAVRVWVVRLVPAGDMGVLSAAERERVSRTESPAVRERLIARRTAIRHILAALVGTDPAELVLERRCERCGKHHPVPLPPIGDTPLFWSSSSTADLLVVATGGRPLGVDVEPVDATGAWAAVARRYFTAAEVAAIGQSAERFAEFWTLKEALLKALGVGILGGLDRLCCATLRSGIGGWLVTPDHPQWSFTTLDVATGVAGALAVQEPDGPADAVEVSAVTELTARASGADR